LTGPFPLKVAGSLPGFLHVGIVHYFINRKDPQSPVVLLILFPESLPTRHMSANILDPTPENRYPSVVPRTPDGLEMACT
jgi:hypothetical protein